MFKKLTNVLTVLQLYQQTLLLLPLLVGNSMTVGIQFENQHHQVLGDGVAADNDEVTDSLDGNAAKVVAVGADRNGADREKGDADMLPWWYRPWMPSCVVRRFRIQTKRLALVHSWATLACSIHFLPTSCVREVHYPDDDGDDDVVVADKDLHVREGVLVRNAVDSCNWV